MISQLKKIALETGFYETGMVEIPTLQYDPAIRKICEQNSCGCYGTSWACPPAVGSLEQCRLRCEQYRHMLLFSGKYDLNDSFDFEKMAESMSHFKKLVEQYDQKISNFLHSYQLLSNEGCGRCKKCTWPDAPCRFPNRLYHSIEGYGFHVNQLADCAGIRYNNGRDTITYFGALLF